MLYHDIVCFLCFVSLFCCVFFSLLIYMTNKRYKLKEIEKAVLNNIILSIVKLRLKEKTYLEH